MGVEPKGNKTGFWADFFTMIIITRIEKQFNKKLFTARYTGDRVRECREEFYITNGDESTPTIDDVLALSFDGNVTPSPASGDGAFFTPTGAEAGTRGDSLVRKDNAGERNHILAS